MVLVAARVGMALLLASGVAFAAAPTASLTDAVRDGDEKVVRTLLRKRVDVNAPEPDGSTALHYAAHQGDLTTVDLLLRAGAKVVANQYGATPLSLAAANGNATVVSRLLRAGANPNAAAPGGETPLMAAARAGRTAAVSALLEAGADPNAKEATRGQTALMWAAAEGHADIVSALITKGADVRAVSQGPSSPKDITEGESIYKRVAPRVDVFTPLQFAVQAGRIDATKALLDAGASLTNETPQGMSVLTLAIANAHYELAALLVDKGADVNVDKVGFSPLLQIARMRTLNIGQFPHPVTTGTWSSLDLAARLIERGAKVDARTTVGFTDGWRGGFGLDATAFLIAAKGGDTQMMRLLAAKGADVKAVNKNGTTAIMAAAGVEMFNPNEDSGTDADGLAALKVAIELGAGDINAVNKRGEAALHGAVYRPTTDIIQYLVDHGASLDLKNKRGRTALELAVLGVGVVDGLRPEAATLLRKLMADRGMKVDDIEEDENRYKFGVEAK